MKGVLVGLEEFCDEMLGFQGCPLRSEESGNEI